MKVEHQEMLHRCFRCGWCKFPLEFGHYNCPSYLKYRFESFAPGGRLWTIRAWKNGDLKNSERFLRILFSCVSCRNCVETCALPKIKDYLLDMMISAKEEIVEGGIIPPEVRDYFKSIISFGNPYKMPAKERILWVQDLDVPKYDGHDFLFYVGDVGSFDDVGKKMAYSVAKLLKIMGISFGILGEEEISDGNDVKVLGESFLFERLAKENIKKFKSLNVKRVITLSPHAYNTMKNDYPALGADFEVYHYTQVLLKGISKLPLKEKRFSVTVHDSCYLGRWNRDYKTVRKIIKSFPRITLIEMERYGKNALCCGGGGGNFFTDILGSGKYNPAKIRIEEALATGAEFLVVVCPICYRMLSDAQKLEEVEDLKVIELSELILELL